MLVNWFLCVQWSNSLQIHGVGYKEDQIAKCKIYIFLIMYFKYMYYIKYIIYYYITDINILYNTYIRAWSWDKFKKESSSSCELLCLECFLTFVRLSSFYSFFKIQIKFHDLCINTVFCLYLYYTLTTLFCKYLFLGLFSWHSATSLNPSTMFY